MIPSRNSSICICGPNKISLAISKQLLEEFQLNIELEHEKYMQKFN